MAARSAAAALVLGAAHLAAPAARAQDATGGAPAAQLGVTVTPDTVTVGDPFVVRVRVRAPRGATVEFPLAPDSASQVELLDPRVVRPSPDTTATDVTALYRAAAWDVGPRSLGMGPVSVRVGSQQRRVPLGDVRVFVRSVLPADTAAPRDPKPPRPIFEPTVPWWQRWWPYLLAGLLALLLGIWIWRRLRRRRGGEEGVDALGEAEAGFARVESLGLVEAGERGRYVTLVVEVLRDYLARRVPEARTSLTSTELLDALAANPAVPVPRLAPLLAEADLVKFARLPVTGERARLIGRTAREIVRDTEQEVVRIEEERAAAAAAAARPVQATTKRRDEKPPRAA